MERIQVLNSVCFVFCVLGLKLLHSTCISVYALSFYLFFESEAISLLLNFVSVTCVCVRNYLIT